MEVFCYEIIVELILSFLWLLWSIDPSIVIVGTKDHKILHLIGRRTILQGKVEQII